MVPARKLQIVYRKTAELIPYARNAKLHPDEQVAQIAGSIEEFGFNNPVLLDEKDIIFAGHGRVLAAGRLKLDELPTITIAGLSETQKRAFRLADNRIAQNGGWDAEMVSIELRALADSGFDATSLGFGKQEIDNILHAFETDSGPVEENPWEGMPEHRPEARAYRSITVHLQDEAAVQDFQERLGQQLAPKAKYLWHPFKPKQDLSAQQWEEDDGGDEDDSAQPEVSDLHPEQGA
jgi:ParB-like chromosome segregation protein Spo0J